MFWATKRSDPKVEILVRIVMCKEGLEVGLIEGWREVNIRIPRANLLNLVKWKFGETKISSVRTSDGG